MLSKYSTFKYSENKYNSTNFVILRELAVPSDAVTKSTIKATFTEAVNSADTITRVVDNKALNETVRTNDWFSAKEDSDSWSD